MCAVIGTPLRSVKDGISVATPARTAATKPGRCTSRKARSEMSTAAYSRPAVTAPYATKCFAQAASDSADDRSVPWKPRTLACAMRALSQGSSPGPSAVRPQRGSRDTSSIGAKVIASPSAAPSRAASRAVRSQRASSKMPASASGIGKSVRWPWMMSRPISSGMPSRDFSTASRCISCAGPAPTMFSRLPIVPSMIDCVESPAITGPVTV